MAVAPDRMTDLTCVHRAQEPGSSSAHRVQQWVARVQGVQGAVQGVQEVPCRVYHGTRAMEPCFINNGVWDFGNGYFDTFDRVNRGLSTI